MGEQLNILCQSNDLYCPFTGIMLESLFYNNTDIETIRAYVISNGIEDHNLKKLNELSAKYGRKIDIIDGGKISDIIKNFNLLEWNGSITAYFKLFALDFIQDDMERLLYLDSDMIVNGSLKELIEVDLQNNIIGMSGGYVNTPRIKNVKGLSECGYNGGMILFDVYKWKENNCTQKILDHLKNVQSKYSCADEDVLNIVVKKIKSLDHKFNTIVPYVMFNSKGGISALNNVLCNKLVCTESEWNNAYNNPIVLHYVRWLCKRPWCKNSNSPMVDIWDKYMSMSAWNNFEKIDDNSSILNKIQRILFKVLPLRIFAFINRNITAHRINTQDKKFRQNMH